MVNDPAVAYSFYLYVLYVLLPLVPAVLIFKLFPETKVTVSGPLQNLTVNATGAFAAYVVTVALGFFLVKNVQAEIVSTRHYAVEGVISDLGKDQGVNSDQFYSRLTNDAQDGSQDFRFVIVLDHPVVKPEKVWLKYYDKGSSGVGAPPLAPNTWVPMELSPKTSPQRFRLEVKNGTVAFSPFETTASSDSNRRTEIALKENNNAH